MRVTRSQTGKTPKKMEHPDFVETPAPRRRTRNSAAPDRTSSSELVPTSDVPPDNVEVQSPVSKPETEGRKRRSNGAAKANKTKGTSDGNAIDGWKAGADPKIDHSGHFEFGGSWGVTAMMIGFPLLMWYMWIGATYYDGRLPRPEKGQDIHELISHLARLAYEGAFPSAKAWAIYWGFILFEATCYMLLPGVTTFGKPLPHEDDRRLSYHCSAVWSLYATMIVAGALHLSGIFPLYTLLDEFGPLMSVAIISGFLVSFVTYFSAISRGAQHRMSGYPIYDFFMGAELNPRLFGILDLKMFLEVRVPWYILFLISAAAAARQYEQYGYVSGEVGFLLMAHFLYANACSKGEECIPPTWDMYYEKLGFMLIFWNMAGVPLSYCHCTLFLANHAPSVYRWNRAVLVFMYVSYLFVYWVWDTAGSQKNRFRRMEHGDFVARKAFPQLPWGTLKDPKTIKTKSGDSLLVDGWYAYARKLHYTCDMYFALMWALVTGFGSPLPWFYPVFFVLMIAHRAARDIQRCEIKYGESWEEYKRQVPYLFIPYVY